MRIASYNVEWFDRLFDDAGRLLNDDGWSARWNITRTRQLAGLTAVFRALDADAVMVIEAPDASRRRDGVHALEVFAAHAGLRARRALIGFSNDTQQEIALLYDPDTVTARHDPRADPEVPQFDGTYRLDLDLDRGRERVRWSKPPLEVALEGAAGPLRLIGVHAKSKAPHGARDADHAMQLAIANRRKQLAQCIWLRARVDLDLAAGDPLIVMGDFNDGPGLDQYEKLFGRSGVEVVLGEEDTDIPLFDPHVAAALERRVGAAPTSARFWLNHEKRWLQALLDYIMVSPDLAARRPTWRIWHPFEDALCFEDKALGAALLDASDHFPVTLDLLG